MHPKVCVCVCERERHPCTWCVLFWLDTACEAILLTIFRSFRSFSLCIFVAGPYFICYVAHCRICRRWSPFARRISHSMCVCVCAAERVVVVLLCWFIFYFLSCCSSVVGFSVMTSNNKSKTATGHYMLIARIATPFFFWFWIWRSALRRRRRRDPCTSHIVRRTVCVCVCIGVRVPIGEWTLFTISKIERKYEQKKKNNKNNIYIRV